MINILIVYCVPKIKYWNIPQQTVRVTKNLRVMDIFAKSVRL